MTPSKKNPPIVEAVPEGTPDVADMLRQVQPAIARHTAAYTKLVEAALALDAHAEELERFKEWRKTHAGRTREVSDERG